MINKLKNLIPASYKKLKSIGILGVNSRNLNYIMEYNPRKDYPLVDNKALTKEICQECGIEVPKTYALISGNKNLKKSIVNLKNHNEFVIKPACGAGGRGILVIINTHLDIFSTSSDEKFTLDDIEYYISTILSGLYSLGSIADSAIIEERIKPHPVFKEYSTTGTPDVRIIVYKKIPIMAMLRLPTKYSKSRANLHQGAVGVGIDLNNGISTYGVWNNQIITKHPETQKTIVGISIPNWNDYLFTALKLSQKLNLQYIGIDIVLNENNNAMVLEANARPGLSIQIANRVGLIKRISKIDTLEKIDYTIDERYEIMMSYNYNS